MSVDEITLCGFDFETTGLKPEDGHKIIEMAFILYKYWPETFVMKPVGKYVQRLFPDCPISADAQNVHHISIDDLVGMPTFEHEANKVVKILKASDVLVAHNADFDTGFLISELEACEKPIIDVPVFCTMSEGRFAKYDGSVPTLRALCESLNVPYDVKAAHQAEYDVVQMMKCLHAGLKEGYFKLPELND